MNTDIKALIFAAKYGGGKSTAKDFFVSWLMRDFPNLSLVTESDRTHLDRLILNDVEDARAPTPGSEGPHAIINGYSDAGEIMFSVKDGALHRKAQEMMIGGIRDIPTGTLNVIEFAIGPDVVITADREPLRQSGQYLLGLLSSHRAMGNVAVIELESSYSTRLRRNEIRPDPVPRGIFDVAATDDGELWKTSHRLGALHVLIQNDVDLDTQGLKQYLREKYENFLLPLLREGGNPYGAEGRYWPLDRR